MKAGLSTYSLLGALNEGKLTVSSLIDFAAAIGSEHLEIVPLGFSLTDNPELIEIFRKKSAEHDMALSSYTIGANLDQSGEALAQEITRIKAEVDIAHQLGVKLMRHDVASPASDWSINSFNSKLGAMANACQQIADYAANYGIVTSVENHGYFIQHSDRVQALVQAVARENYRTTLDVGNFVCVDENPIVAVRNNLPISSMIHYKDFYIRSNQRNPGQGWFRSSGGNYLRGAILGHGDLDIYEITRIIKHSGYDGFISLEFEGMEDAMTASEIGLNNLRRMWDEV